MTDMDFGAPFGMGGLMGGIGPGDMGGFSAALGGMGMPLGDNFNMGSFQGGRGGMNHGRGGGRMGSSGRLGGTSPHPPRAPPPDMLKRGRHPDKGNVPDGPDLNTGILKMRGLPFSAVVEDIVSWFNSGDLAIPPLTADW